VEADRPASELAPELALLKQELFPVVAPGTRKLVGVLSKSDLVAPPRTRLSLVDHNEFSQAVKGVEEAEVVEVIDHHRLSGDFVTSEPVRFLNEPVGSSSTIVARRFREAGLQPDAPTALCLAAGLISDTLNLTSPTTTDVDREILIWLSGLAGVEADRFAAEFFAAGSLLIHGTAREIFASDRKEFHEAGRKISLSQIEELSLDAFAARRPELERDLQEIGTGEGYDLVALLVTDIQRHASLLMAMGARELLEALEFKRVDHCLFEAPGVVSRKKQLFPAICRAIGKAQRSHAG
jgi:manganese-dependent inorganic pyrophosphatase